MAVSGAGACGANPFFSAAPHHHAEVMLYGKLQACATHQFSILKKVLHDRWCGGSHVAIYNRCIIAINSSLSQPTAFWNGGSMAKSAHTVGMRNITMRQGQPEISHPMSGSKRKRRSLINNLFLGVALLLLMAISLFLFMSDDNERGKRDTALSLKKMPTKKTLVLETKHGTIKIVLRPDLSGRSSMEYIAKLVQGECSECEFYRAEKDFLFQGVVKNDLVKDITVDLGDCPHGAEAPEKCFEHDPNCACHGPIMTHGMVGWVGGGSGPDFFITTQDKPVTHWMTTHTVWGEVQDDESFRVIDHIYTLPMTKDKTMLEERIPFKARLTENSIISDECKNAKQ